MNQFIHTRTQRNGFTLVEVLVTIVVASIALLGLAGLQITGLRANMSSEARSKASVMANDIAERMRNDIDEFSIDDGRGAVLEVTLSIGFVTWEPQQFPAIDMDQLAQQMETVGGKALHDARARGGNCVAQGRLSTMVL